MIDVLQTLALHRSQFVAFVHKRVRALPDAEDLVNGAFVKAATSVAQLRSRDDAQAWFYRVLRHAIIDFYRSSQPKERASDAMDEHAAITLEVPSACACAAPLLAQLPSAYAEILQTVADSDDKAVHGKPGASYLDGASRVRLSRARSAMRQKIADRCGTTSARPCGDCAC